MNLQIRAFGIARDILGDRLIAIETPAGATVGDLKNILLEKYPAFESLSSLLIAVNAEYSSDSHILSEQDEIALIPPVSGG
ncbi:MAG: molybdopterin converting factor subunit 1 [Saprospiraceae bacterium]